MVNERIRIPLNVSSTEEVMIIDEDKITPVCERTYVIVYKPAPRTPTPPPRPRTPTPEPRIFSLEVIIGETQGASIAIETQSITYNSVEEAIRGAVRIISGQDIPDMGNTFTRTIFDIVGPVKVGWTASTKLRNAAGSAIQSVIQNYQNGSNVNGWIKITKSLGNDPNISWSY